MEVMGCSGTPAGNGDGEVGNVPTPASPDGAYIQPVNVPVEDKSFPFSSPNGGNPRRGSEIGAPLPS